MQFEVDAIEARNKLAGLSGIGRAYRYILTRWSSLAIRHIKESIRGRLLNTRTAHLSRNVGFKISGNENRPQAVLGTGIPPAQSVVYAQIQEKGGTIKPRNRKYLTVPLPGIKGVAANFPDSFILKSKTGKLLIVERDGKGGLRPLFALKTQVQLPAREWFSTPLAEMSDLLQTMVSPPEALRMIGVMSVKGGE